MVAIYKHHRQAAVDMIVFVPGQKVGLVNEEKQLERGGIVAKNGLYANIHAKQERIAHGSGEKMRKPGSKGAPTAEAFKESAKTAKPTRKEMIASKMKDM
jgi:hypothetical protein